MTGRERFREFVNSIDYDFEKAQAYEEKIRRLYGIDNFSIFGGHHLNDDDSYYNYYVEMSGRCLLTVYIYDDGDTILEIGDGNEPFDAVDEIIDFLQKSKQWVEDVVKEYDLGQA